MLKLSRPFKKGNTFRFPFQVKGSDGLPQNITDWTIEGRVRDEHGELIQNLTVSLVNVSIGSFAVSAEPAETELWDEGFAFVDVKITDIDGVVLSTDDIRLLIVEA